MNMKHDYKWHLTVYEAEENPYEVCLIACETRPLKRNLKTSCTSSQNNLVFSAEQKNEIAATAYLDHLRDAKTSESWRHILESLEDR